LRKGPWYEFTSNDDPKCPHCGATIDVQEHELWQLYEQDGDTDIECPHCSHRLQVKVHTKFTFSTDEQDELEEEDDEAAC
jgi:DNA-directed RNA polymerase subunit RPC12/RpoP